MFHDFFELEDLYFTGLLVVLHLDVSFIAEFFLCGRSERLFQSFYENLAVDPLVSTDLFDDPLYV